MILPLMVTVLCYNHLLGPNQNLLVPKRQFLHTTLDKFGLNFGKVIWSRMDLSLNESQEEGEEEEEDVVTLLRKNIKPILANFEPQAVSTRDSTYNSRVMKEIAIILS